LIKMKNKTSSYSIILNKIAWIGVGMGMLSWVIETLADHYYGFGQGTLMAQLINPGPHELRMRLIIAGMFILSGVLAQNIISKRNKAEERIAIAHAELNQIFETAADGNARYR
jgi:hypothetical protein